jgi:hypothetical protein
VTALWNPPSRWSTGQLTKKLMYEISTHLGQLDDDAIAAVNERLSQPQMALYAVTDPDAEPPGQATAVGWACRFPPEWTDVLSVNLRGPGRDWDERSGSVWNIDHPIVRLATADGTVCAEAEISDYLGSYPKIPPIDLDSMMSSQSFAAAWLSKYDSEPFFLRAWAGLEASVCEAIWRNAFNLGPTTPVARRRIIAASVSYAVALTPDSGEQALVRLDRLPKPSEQWWLGVVRNDEPS